MPAKNRARDAGMKLLNFSIGQIQTVQIGGESVRTAHVKMPVAEPWLITPDGAAGDERAVHPDKIYAFARSAYDYWAEYLGVDRMKWPDGFFGENLTLDTLDEEDIRIGDEFTIGNDVRLVVAGARTPCIKLAWRLGQPRTFQKIFAKSRRTGAYFGVISGGEVQPGDVLRRTHHDATMPSVADVCDFICSHKPVPLEPLKKLLAFDKLSPAVRLLLNAKLDTAERAANAVQGRWRGWRPFVIKDIVDETADVKSIYLLASDGQPLCQPQPGQFVSVRMAAGDGSWLVRPWSISHFLHEMETYRLTVRRQPGAGSDWMHAARPGASVFLRAPAGEFTLDMGGIRPIVLIAAGIGITPLFAMLQAQLKRGQAAPVHLFYGARTPDDIVFRDELNAMAQAHQNLSITYVYSRCDDGGQPARRITPQFVIDALRGGLYVTLDGRRVDLPWYESDLYICGPGTFCQSMKDAFEARGANPDHIFMELFTATVEEKPDVETADVTFQKSGIMQRWEAQEDLSLLELAEKAGLNLEYDCRAGSCLTCRTPVLSGATTTDIGDGTSLLCVGRPNTPSLVLDC